MSRSRLFGLATLLAGLLSFSALVPLGSHQDGDLEARPITYNLTGGSSVRGVIVGSEPGRVRLRVSVAGGTAMRWYNVSNFDDVSQVRLAREQVPEGDLSAQLAVAELAEEKGLTEMARTELRRCAHMIHDGEALPPAVRERAIELIVQLVDSLCAEGKISEARSAVTRIITRQSSSLSVEEQDRLISTVEAASDRAIGEQNKARRAKEDARVVAERERKLKPVLARMDKGKERRRKGLLNSRQFSAASRDLHGAAKEFELALADIDRLSQQFADDPLMIAELEDLGAQCRTQWHDSLLSAASLELVRGSYGRAMESVNTVLLVEPQNEQALAMRARIEVSQSDWGWRWR